MQLKREQITPTSIKLTLSADQTVLDKVKLAVLNKLSKNVKVPGFRPGKAPASLVEKSIDQSVLQTEFIDNVVNDIYLDAIEQTDIRPVAAPKIVSTKFVPFTTLEFTADVDVVGDSILADYKSIKQKLAPVEISNDEVKTVLENLRERAATKTEVTRPAKLGDELIIDFKGMDKLTKKPIDGGEGKDYPLILGSKSFIEGFEDKLVGTKAGTEKALDLTFPSNYGSPGLQNKKVTFDVTIHKVKELKLPALDDAFAATVGPFKSLAELKADVKKQLQAEKQQEATRKFDNELIQKIADKSEVSIPAQLIEDEIDRIEEDDRRNVVYRGQTWQEHLDSEGVTEVEHREKQRVTAELRVKAGLILGEISAKEGLTVTPEELEVRLQLLKGQYNDPAMLAELDKPDNRRDIMSRLITEKTIDKLRQYATKTTS
ncbi:MAG: trigger factor [Candidatus Saccharimonadales bacterium]